MILELTFHRISLLAHEECFASRLYVHYHETHMLLCIFAKENSRFLVAIFTQ